MTTKNGIAWTYLISVPVILILFLFENGAMVTAKSSQAGLTQAAMALDECETISASLDHLESISSRYDATGSASFDEMFRAGVAQLHAALKGLQDSTQDGAAGPKTRKLAELVQSQTDAWQGSMDERKSGRSSVRTGAEALAPQRSAGIADMLGEIKHDQQARIEGEKSGATRGLVIADNLIKYSAALILWIVMVAAFLLFHDEKVRDWAGVERRAHTRILQELPLSVCLSSESGVIIYANRIAEEVFGYRPGELLAQGEAVPDEDKGRDPRRMLGRTFDRLRSGEVWSGRLPIARTDGEVVDTASWIKNLEVREKRCELVIHCAEGGVPLPTRQTTTTHA